MTSAMSQFLESDGTSDDVSDWGSDFDEDPEECISNNNQYQINVNQQIHNHNQVSLSVDYGDLYEIPDGKPAISTSGNNTTPHPIATIVPDWLRKPKDVENITPPSASTYIEHVLLPTRASKDDDSKNFIETLKRKLSQRNLLLGNNKPVVYGSNGGGGGGGYGGSNISGNGSLTCDPKTGPQQQKSSHHAHTPQDLRPDELELVRKAKESLYKVPWFYRVDRGKAELILENCNSDGSFLVRECHHGGPKVPFTLTIRFLQRLFHVQIRLRSDSKFALGTAKQNEMHFSTVQEMIDIYRKTPLQLHSNGKYFGETKLTHPPIVYSFSKNNNANNTYV